MEDHNADSAAYIVSEMLSKIHGIPWPTVKRRRAELKLVSRERAEAKQDATEMSAELAAAFAKKTMR